MVITSLPESTALSDDDVFPVVDVSESTTHKIRRKNLFISHAYHLPLQPNLIVSNHQEGRLSENLFVHVCELPGGIETCTAIFGGAISIQNTTSEYQPITWPLTDPSMKAKFTHWSVGAGYIAGTEGDICTQVVGNAAEYEALQPSPNLYILLDGETNRFILYTTRHRANPNGNFSGMVFIRPNATATITALQCFGIGSDNYAVSDY